MKGFFKRLGEVWTIAGITLLFFILIEIFFRIYFMFSTSDDPRIQADCYQSAEWVKDYYTEFARCNDSRWEPYVYWKRKPFTGEYINVDQKGLRKTMIKSHPLSKNQPEIDLFFFGGSSMWGSGIKDANTIPSLTGSELTRKGFNLSCTNFGESGYVSTQEVTKLILELKNGHVPDIVIFYDGANDMFSSLQSGKAGIPQNEYKREKEFNTLKEKKKSFLLFFQSLRTLSTVQFINRQFGVKQIAFKELQESELQDLAQSTVHYYNENIRLVNALAKEYGFAAFFYWQPTIFNKVYLSEYEKSEMMHVNGLRKFTEEVNSRLFMDDLLYENIRFYNLTNLFGEIRDPLFIDWCHICKNGNLVVSQRLARDLMPVIDSLNTGDKQFNE